MIDVDYVINLRRHFHKYPELSGQEINTCRKIKEELKKMHITYEDVGDYGVIGTLKGRNPGKTIVLRADIDALPIMESETNTRVKKNVVSSISGVCHACGHDGHVAMLLASAKELASQRENFDGTILFCFEQGEEDGSGIKPMLKALSTKDVDGVWGIHLAAGIESGKICVEEGPRMSGVHFFSVNVTGKGGHGSSPHETIDPINCTVNILSSLSSIITREINPRSTAVLTVGKLHAGNAPNVIPNTAEFAGTIRYFDPEVSKKVLASFYNIVKNVAQAHGCEVEISMREPGYPVINDSKLSKLAKTSIVKSIGEEFLVSTEPWMASESMGYYLKEYPGVFAFLGIANEKLGTGASHHNPEFDIDESSLQNGVDSTVGFTLDFLKTYKKD